MTTDSAADCCRSACYGSPDFTVNAKLRMLPAKARLLRPRLRSPNLVFAATAVQKVEMRRVPTQSLAALPGEGAVLDIAGSNLPINSGKPTGLLDARRSMRSQADLLTRPLSPFAGANLMVL